MRDEKEQMMLVEKPEHLSDIVESACSDWEDPWTNLKKLLRRKEEGSAKKPHNKVKSFLADKRAKAEQRRHEEKADVCKRKNDLERQERHARSGLAK